MLGSTGVTSVVNMASDKFLAVLGTSYSVSSPAILLGSSGVTTDILLASDYQVSLESGSAVSIMVCELLSTAVSFVYSHFLQANATMNIGALTTPVPVMDVFASNLAFVSSTQLSATVGANLLQMTSSSGIVLSRGSCSIQLSSGSTPLQFACPTVSSLVR